MSEVIQRDAEEVEHIAANKGLVCFLPDDYEIMVDADHEDGPSQRDRATADQVMAVMGQNGLYLTDELITRSVGGNSHIYYKSNQILTALERIMIQAALGSDPVREVLSLIRIRGGSTAPTALFETEEEAEKVRNWRDQIIKGVISL